MPARSLAAGVLALLLTQAAAASEPAVPDGYAVHQSLALDQAANGMTGALQILEDSRIGPALRAEMWRQTTDTDLILDEKNPLRATFAKAPPRPAHLRLVDGSGKVVADQPFDVPLADIDRQQLHDGTPTFLVSADHSLGTGADAGLETRFMAVDHGELVPEDLPGQPFLRTSLKNAWKIVDDTTPGSKAIQVVACHPNLAKSEEAATGGTVVDLTTYRYAQGAWHDTTVSLVGYWESSEDWPDGQFP